MLRIFFAALVLLSHAPELGDGDRHREIFTRLFHNEFSIGNVGVFGFFLLSGYLILRSWTGDPHLLDYLRKRVLRIVPGYLVAVLLSVLVLGLVDPSVPHFFSHLGWPFVRSLLTLQEPVTPAVAFDIVPQHAGANGSLWTIAYEFRCYLFVALVGTIGLLRRRGLWVALAVLVLLVTPHSHRFFFALNWGARLSEYLGTPLWTCRFLWTFLVGGGFFLYRNSIPFRLPLAFAAAVALVACQFNSRLAFFGLTLCGGYLLFFIGQLPHRWMRRLGNFPDISYGIYLYGWPVEVLLIRWLHQSIWLVFAFSLPICAVLGWLSWHFVERPMLRLAGHHTARIPGP